MKFVHHHLGEWVKSDDWTSSSRSDPSVTEYDSIESIKDEWLRKQFEFALEIGAPCLQCGEHVFQVRQA